MTTSVKEPPLVDVKVSNPVTYLRRWWDRVMGKEGVDFRFTIHPITAFLIAFGVASAFFGIGRYSVNIPFLKYQIIPTTKPTLLISAALIISFVILPSNTTAKAPEIPFNVASNSIVGTLPKILKSLSII